MKKIILRKNIKGNTSTNNFKYPKAGEYVEAPDWEATTKCRNGLHGWDENNHTYCSSEYKGNWVVLEVNTKDGFIELGDKVKFRKGKVLYNGKSLNKAKKLLPAMFPIHFDSQISQKDNEVQKAGLGSTQTAGSDSTQTAGSFSTQKAGSDSTQTAGSDSTHTINNKCYVTTGLNSTITHRWYDDAWKVMVMIVTEEYVDKKLYFEDGVMSVVDK